MAMFIEYFSTWGTLILKFISIFKKIHITTKFSLYNFSQVFYGPSFSGELLEKKAELLLSEFKIDFIYIE